MVQKWIKPGAKLTAVLLFLALAAGCNIDGASGTSQRTAGSNPEDSYIGEESALSSALSHAQLNKSDISHLTINLDHKDGSAFVYDVDFVCDGYEYDYDIDAVTGEVIKQEKELDDNIIASQVPAVSVKPADNSSSISNAPSAGADSSTYIGEANAKAAALTHAKVDESRIYNYKYELDRDYGSVRYEIEFDCDGYEYDYEIDALDGSVLKNQKEKDDSVSPHKSSNVSSPSAYIGEQQAKAAALAHSGVDESGIYNYKCELDHDHGIALYEIEFDCDGYEYDYEIDALDGSVLKNQKEKDDSVSPHKSSNVSSPNTYIGEQQAKAAALAHAGVDESRIYNYKCELDHDHGVVLYEIEFDCDSYEYDYEIDALDGSVLKNKKERD